MGVPAFFRWLSEKYPKCIQDVLEERVPLDNSNTNTGMRPVPMFDWRRPNPNGQLFPADAECDNLYIDMNGIIHPCAHPEHGLQPSTEQQMYVNVAAAVDRLVRVIRPRRLLYLAIDGVAPRAKMNQQRSRRFRAAQEARELKEMEDAVRVEIFNQDGSENNLSTNSSKQNKQAEAWDSNVITPGTPFMLGLSIYLRFYIRQRLSTDPSWKHLTILFSDASIPGEGEHKIMAHVRLQRAQPGYRPDTVHVLHGLDADLIMLALATHEAHFYISREEVLFGRKSVEQQEQRQLESGFTEAQRLLDQAVGDRAMQLPENQQKPLQRVSIPILREYLQVEFDSTLHEMAQRRAQHPSNTTLSTPSLERVIDDFVFLCFFVGNDFLPHLPSLDIRDGALDFLLNVYKRIVPQTGYLTAPGGNLQLAAINVILAEVGAIEDYVFQLKHENETRRREADQARRKANHKGIVSPPPDGTLTVDPQYTAKGRAAKILAQQTVKPLASTRGNKKNNDNSQLSMGSDKVTHHERQDNAKAAHALKELLSVSGGETASQTMGSIVAREEEESEDATGEITTTLTADLKLQSTQTPTSAAAQKPSTQSSSPQGGKKRKSTDKTVPSIDVTEDGVGVEGDMEVEFDGDENDEEDEDGDDEEEKPPEPEIPVVVEDPQVAKAFKEKVKAIQHKKLDEYAKNVVDNVRLHEAGWKDRYYSDKCKADDVSQHGGKEHLFRTYVMGLVWVMKYYYDGCPSWKFYFPFHYAPFASDLQNIERFARDIKSFSIGKPFNPVEQLMAVLPSDSAHAIPKAARWLMTDPESPILEFYPTDVPVDPNGKAMPWLWVVLLPFIDEDALLTALGSTMSKWTKDELLCNVRGLDDAYLYIHISHPLRSKLTTVLHNGRTAKDPKIKLNDSAAYGFGGFSGSLRPPLSDELYPIDDVERVKIPPPPSADKIEDPLPDNLFLEEIHANMAICVAFSEPLKLPHKSILLPGAKPPKPVLTDEDKRLRRPRINRGASIAHMGLSNGKSHQSRYGSMNISSYERELAIKQGRGNQMQQTGTRSWGSMEPTQKRPRVNVNPFHQQHNYYQQQQQQQHAQLPSAQAWERDSSIRYAQSYGGNRGPPAPDHYRQTPQHSQSLQQPQQQPPSRHRQPYQPPYQHERQTPRYPPPQYGRSPPQPQYPHREQQQHAQGQRAPFRAQQTSHTSDAHEGQPRQGFSFRQGPQSEQNQPQQRSRTSADTMRSLREQLSSTLNQNRRREG